MTEPAAFVARQVQIVRRNVDVHRTARPGFEQLVVNGADPAADRQRPDTEPDMDEWVEFNRKYSEMWPVITQRKDPLPEAEARDGEPGKRDKYFSEAAGSGD